VEDVPLDKAPTIVGEPVDVDVIFHMVLRSLDVIEVPSENTIPVRLTLAELVRFAVKFSNLQLVPTVTNVVGDDTFNFCIITDWAPDPHIET
jgi:hypothetical protein